MIAILNGFNLNDGTTGVYLDVEIDGLELPDIRTSSGNYAGRDGGYIGAQFYEPRDVTLQGNVWGANGNVGSLELARRNFQNAIRSKAITLELITNAGYSYIVYCNLIDFKMPLMRDLFTGTFKLELLATDPTIYDNATGNPLAAIVRKVANGGYTYPVIYPVVYAAGELPTTVTNNGDVLVYPIITLTNVMDDPIITNETTGEIFSLSPLVTSPGDEVVIDMRAHTVLLNGGNIFDLVTTSSSWWGLVPGTNSLSLTSSGGGDNVTAMVSYRSGYMGI